jgi:acyl-CoA synthetase (AMP-forming)/AMP-acid ligase II
VRWTYAEFDAICNRLAQGLRDHGVAFGDHVAILARNSHAYAAVRFAVARLGAVLVPVNFMLQESEGYITIIDRKKDIIKTGGECVASREIEETLYGHPSVSEAAVIGVPHDKWLEAVLAVVLLKQGHSLTEEVILEHRKERLAHFKVPKRVLFVDKLPKNPSGKLLKQELRQVYANVFKGSPD